MKKAFVGLMVGLVLLPNVTFAATNQENYRSLLLTLISLLQQQVAVLTQQLSLLDGGTPSLTATAIPNVIPASSQVSTDTPISARQDVQLIPSSITIRDRSPDKIFGGNCGNYTGLVTVYASVLDQYGVVMQQQSVSWTNPDTGAITHGTTTPEYQIRFNAQQVSGTMPITVTSGNISTTTYLSIITPMKLIESPTHILQTKGNIAHSVEDVYINTDTMTCVSKPSGWDN